MQRSFAATTTAAEINFNAPVTININIYKSGKGGKRSSYKSIKE
ncbi:hypothetical protein BFJ63_vAg9716 [Fusarium oxysporum f. sp. narcissi]|uniref:Uncharacterized protein n=2 Tax=Fusarium oxysporum TaxID=5507 RepID=A0A4Q2VLU8_FUSOX|nr:hypothetical protein FOMA001_g146 [Fusarium oxysporum f. sp. matthiolae]RKK28961.1 hypothetical protein BFJ65_g902 [Fusarium oxysporum f. sp. cepae]RKL29074.1 hypothetical protein BFJ70_g10786 [Fusarium oxysporum]RYC87407.1 hypothetical protein BFJ63_vAg9716 [Fusarium oxysporum f. sp. narcissi]RKK38763.1 hypothetical protein BFJ67_g11720 [Fusarium oxysporum f. sp. cepae]